MFSSFKEKLNTSLSTLQETRSGATTGSIGITTGTTVDSLVDTSTHDPGSTITSPTSITASSSSSSLSSTAAAAAASTSTTPASVLRQGSIGALGSSLASRFSAVGGASSSSFFRRPQTSAAASSSSSITTSATTTGAVENRASLDLISFESSGGGSGQHHRLVTLVQQLTLDPREEKADPARLSKIREEYRRRPSTSSARPSTSSSRASTSGTRPAAASTITTGSSAAIFTLEDRTERKQKNPRRQQGGDRGAFEEDDQDEDAEQLFSQEDHLSMIDLQDPLVIRRSTSTPRASHEPIRTSMGGAGAEISEEVVEKLEILQRYETRFPDLARAFKKLVHEKMAAERVLKATTALEDMADVEALEAHLQNMSTKSEMSMQEIRRLSDELRSTIKTNEAESAKQKETIESLQGQIATHLKEIDTLKADKEALVVQLEQQKQQHQKERSSDTDSIKVNSMDIHVTSTPTSPIPSPSPSLISLIDTLQSSTPIVMATPTSPSLPPQPSPTLATVASPTTPTISTMPTISTSAVKDKKQPSKVTKNKDQALRELMIRLENVLKEKNQAREEQEEAQEQLQMVQSRLEKELEVNQAMVQKMDLLQSQVAEMEEKERRVSALAKKKELELEKASEEKKGVSDEETNENTSIRQPSTSSDLSTSVTEQHLASEILELKEAISKSEQESRDASEREQEALAAKQEKERALEELHKAHQILEDSIARTEKELKESQALVKQLQESIQTMETTERDLVQALEASKQDLVETLEEVKEKQRLLELERTWREEAEASRDGLKREHETLAREAMKNREDEQLQQDQWRQQHAQSQEMVKEMTERIHTLEQELLSLTKERDELEGSLQSSVASKGELPNESEQIEQLNQELKQTMSLLETRLSEKQALESLVQEHERTIEQLKEEQDRATLDWKTRVSVLESEIMIASKQHEDERAEIRTKLADMEVLEATQSGRIQELEAKKSELAALLETLQDSTKPTGEPSKAEASSKADTSESNDRSTPQQRRISGLEELSSLKQERAELSEKLTRLERLHQGFERDSYEKVQSFEKELALLLQQKAALEAQVQEQSDLLIKEKEKEKELEQQRVAEGIERVRLELEAVRTAERFASAKVTELAKDRDQVVEKVVKLEGRLEKLRECKVGQEQSLTSRIEELTAERDQLSEELEKLKAEAEELTTDREERVKRVRQESAESILVLQSERDRALSDLALKEETLSGSQTEKQLTQERIQTLTSDLESRSTELEQVKAQLDDLRKSTSEEIEALTKEVEALKQERDSLDGQRAVLETQVQELRQSTSHQIDTLSRQVETLAQERDTLDQQRVKLESQLQESASQAEQSIQKLTVLQSDTDLLLTAKTESQEQLADLQSQIRSLTLRERDSKESLTLAKSTIHQRDQDLSTLKDKIESTEALLEQSRQQISQLEKEKQSLQEQIETLKATMTKQKQDAKSAASLNQTKHASVTLELQKLKATHVKTLQERDRIQKEKEQLTTDLSDSQEKLKRHQAEMETLQKMQESTEGQLKECQGQLKEARNRVDTLEELTSIAKRVAETKVTELEMLKSEASEFERQLKMSKEERRKESEMNRRSLKDLTQTVEQTEQTLGQEIVALKKDVADKQRQVEKLKEGKKKKEDEVEEMKQRLETREQDIEQLEEKTEELTGRRRDLELEVQHFKDLEALLAKEKTAHETTVEEFKMRENHLRTINKTLKEEVRKLQRHLPAGSSPMALSPNSPYTQSNPPQTPMQNLGSHHGGLLPKGQQLFLNSPNTPKPHSVNTSGQVVAGAPLMTPPATPRFKVKQQNEPEEVNVEYLKNVLLNFMEHKERRQQLIPVVAEMLKLSTDETKRFSKVI
ncbi:hypothetical protein EMPS_07660 [Entomortierella parvispora]|uniref:GRIP domain-containing protein n=1 Tax=Entomortierella parvispora TaxID=205924 RepID=A0A9P3HFD3_9FUNG|nr:hypothetical protein EMPS_07660 [Entomortierella parvispora]